MEKKQSFENTRRLMDLDMMVDERIEEILFNDIVDTRKKAVSELNRQVYELAEKEGCSIWDICLRTIPKYEHRLVDNTPYVSEYEYYITLEPIDFEFEKGGGYWKDKYYRLKERLQELIDNKED